ncbi:TolC family protein [Flavobacterium aurantiibacter]|uniref:Transporter n=1 Tax=Flavobacterium aurantiibacter TaxID=2023067 RepID=A0A255ZN17_9FLAO|nr:TolC family protein [Flavobacterium aurantiibacter]OYQ42275.1 transporter [Flavobacterium aurantiibacter]
MPKVKAQLIVVFVACSGVFSSFAQAKKWTLLECVNYALEKNISVQQSALDLETAKIERSDAIGNYLPSISANGNHSWNIGLNQNITTGLLENQTTQFTSAGLNSSVTIFSGLSNLYRYRRAKLSELASQYRLSKMKDDISLNVANAYLQILFNKENLKIQQEQLNNNLKQEARSKDLVEAGSIPRGDLLDIQATVATNRQTLAVAENSLLISKLSLAQLLQLEDFRNFDTVDADYPVQNSATMLESPETIYEKAKKERVEIKIAQANLDLAQRDIQIAKAAYSPTLQGFYSFNTRAAYTDRIVGFEPNTDNPTSVIGTVDVNGSTFNVLQPNFRPVLGGPRSVADQFVENKGHQFGLQLTIPILNGFSSRNSVRRAKIAFQRAQTNLDQENLTLERNVFQAFTDANAALKTYEAAVTAVEARGEAFKYATERFNVGLMNAFDLSQAQTLYVNAQAELSRAKYDYIFKVKVVEFYFGIPIMQQ